MTLHIGMVGTGSFALKHGRLLQGMDGVEVTAICGSSQEKADALAKEFNNAKGYASIHHMVDSQRLDAVYICVPPFAHGEIELVLAERGIPFLVEKPLGTDIQTPSAILRAVEEKNLLTSVAYHFRYTDAASRAKTMLQEQTAGMALGYWSGGMPGVYWWRKLEGSGGQFVEQTTHLVDLLRFFMGEVTEVYAAYAQRVIHEKHEGVTVPDVGIVTLKMQSGAIANISNTCMLPTNHWTGLHLYTANGTLEVTGNGLKAITVGQTTEYHNRSNPYEAENQAFIHAVRTGDSSQILSSYADAWKTQQITIAANQSAQTGKPILLASLLP